MSLQKRLTQRQDYDYLATMKRLINVAQDEDFWLIVSMIPEAGKPDNLSRPFGIASLLRESTSSRYPLNQEEAVELVERRLEHARVPDSGPPTPVFPFPGDFVSVLRPTTISLPRRLVKVHFYAVAEAQRDPMVTRRLSRIPPTSGGKGVSGTDCLYWFRGETRRRQAPRACRTHPGLSLREASQ